MRRIPRRRTGGRSCVGARARLVCTCSHGPARMQEIVSCDARARTVRQWCVDAISCARGPILPAARAFTRPGFGRNGPLRCRASVKGSAIAQGSMVLQCRPSASALAYLVGGAFVHFAHLGGSSLRASSLGNAKWPSGSWRPALAQGSCVVMLSGLRRAGWGGGSGMQDSRHSGRARCARSRHCLPPPPVRGRLSQMRSWRAGCATSWSWIRCLRGPAGQLRNWDVGSIAMHPPAVCAVLPPSMWRRMRSPLSFGLDRRWCGARFVALCLAPGGLRTGLVRVSFLALPFPARMSTWTWAATDAIARPLIHRCAPLRSCGCATRLLRHSRVGWALGRSRPARLPARGSRHGESVEHHLCAHGQCRSG